MLSEQIKFDIEALVGYCKQHKIKKLAIFGSAVDQTMTPESDLDILVAFRDYQGMGLLQFVAMERELGAYFQGVKKIDLVTEAALSQYFRAEVLKHSVILYEEKENR